jgi:hypothetical protein
MKYVYRHGKGIAVDTINAATPARKRKPFVVRFVKLSNYWIERLRHARKVSTVTLAHVILREEFKRQHVDGEIILSTAVTGLSRHRKVRAVRELVDLGLIEIEQKGNQAIRVTHLIEREEEKKRIRPLRILRRHAAYPQAARGVVLDDTRQHLRPRGQKANFGEAAKVPREGGPLSRFQGGSQ